MASSWSGKKWGSRGKDVIREHVRSLVKPGYKIFSLPYTNFFIEEAAGTAYCAEYNKDVYARQQKLAPDNCILNYGYASQVLHDHGPFDLIFLDTCGSISNELYRSLRAAKLTRRGDGNLIITLLKCREHPRFEEFRRTRLSRGRLAAYKEMAFKNGKWYIYKTIEYYDTSPMIVLFLGRKAVVTEQLIIN